MNPDLQLRDIHLPADVSWWPPAIGWWVLLFLLLALLFAFFKFRKAKQPILARSICEPALRELARIEGEYAEEPDRMIKELSILLRRSAISIHGRHRISGLTGNDWLSFLDQESGAPLFNEPLQRMLTELPYREHTETGTGNLVQAVRQWLEAQQQKEVRHV